MMHGVRGFFRFAHIDGLIPADPAVYARLPKIHTDESRTQGLDRLELIRFLQIAQTITVHHGALAYLLGINALRASEAAAVRIEDYRETLRGHRVLHLVGKGNKPATMPLTVPVLRVLEACRGERTEGPLVLRPVSGKPIDRRDCYRMVLRIAKAAGIPRHISPHSLRHAAITNALDAGVRSEMLRSWRDTPTPAPPSTTTAHAATSTATASTSSPPTSQASDCPAIRNAPRQDSASLSPRRMRTGRASQGRTVPGEPPARAQGSPDGLVRGAAW
jgi:integrase